MQRRAFTLGLAAALPLMAGCAPGMGVRQTLAPAQAAVFIPGYHPRRVALSGEPADSRRRGRDGPLTLLTRIAPDGGVRQAIYPLIAHDVAISPDRRVGFFGRMNLGGGEGAAHHAAFDPETLEMVALGRSLGPGWRGGGHGVFLPDGSILCSERAPDRPLTGRAADHYGRLSRRDPMTLKVLDSVSCHGIDPHELRLTEDGRRVIVANYGSVAGRAGAQPRQVVEPSVTVVDLASGDLVDRVAVPDPHLELRHLALGRDGKVFAIRAHQAAAGAAAAWLRAIGDDPAALPVDPNPGVAYLPGHPVLVEPGRGGVTVLAKDQPEAHLMEGLSVEYDPQHDEFIAIFPSSHRLMVFDAAGGLRQSIDMRGRGLIRPSGLALLPGSDLYAVAGYWQGLLLIARGTHRVVTRLDSAAPVVGGHSHMTAA